MTDKRGLVISPPMVFSGSKSLQIGGSGWKGGLDPQELRSNLLFSDRPHWPDQNAVGFTDDDADFLQSAGVLQRTMVKNRSRRRR